MLWKNIGKVLLEHYLTIGCDRGKICGTFSGQNGHDADQMIIASNTLDDPGPGGGGGEDSATITIITSPACTAGTQERIT